MKYHRFFRWGVPVLSLTVTLLLCEAGYRIYKYRSLLDASEGDYLILDRPLYQLDEKSGYRYLPNQTFTPLWMGANHQLLRVNQVHTNNHGYRMSRDIEKEKPSDEFRIAIIGDSLSACIHNNQPWPEILETYLNEDRQILKKLGKRKIRVVNFARDGIALEQFPAIVENEIASFSPDTLLVNFITADIYRKFIWRKVTSLPGSSHQYQVVLNCAALPAEVSNPGCSFAGVLIFPPGTKVAPEVLAEIKKELAKKFVSRLNWLHPYPELLSFLMQGKLESFLGRNPYEPMNLNIEGRENGILRSAEGLRQIKRLMPQSHFLHLPVYWEIIYQAVPKLAAEVMEQVPELQIQPMINYMPETKDKTEVDPWVNYPSDMHFSDLGAKIYAKAVYQYFKDRVISPRVTTLIPQSHK
jgi:hypothetical protein